ncbi:MBL-fold metallo-hydrolase superfamily [hydrothermal vent metagenome]|uniref:MBL-fold metallo-hydrolase superfamily n=1 Tax=hydrothermal vent metagenome TaxID=652676 RepID=A0A3B0V5L6_9ZZZZ
MDELAKGRFVFDGFEITRVVVGDLAVNCYILWDQKTREAVVIDPGGDPEDIIDAVEADKLDVKYVINTHGHFDHVGADGDIIKAFGAKLAIHSADAPMLENAGAYSSVFGVNAKNQPPPDIAIEHGSVIRFGGIEINVLGSPGHTPGGVLLSINDGKAVITGDSIFAGSIGRTDLPGGSYEDLMTSLRDRVLPMADDTRLFPGHGPDTTVREEKAGNPYLQEML